MAFSAIFNVLKYIPASSARKALEKVHPGFKNYFSKAVGYGVDANRALDYLSERFESDAQRQHKDDLEKGAANNTLRPDEQVSRSQISNDEMPAKALKTAAAFGIGGTLGKEKEDIPPEANSPATPASQPLHPREEAIQKMKKMKNHRSMLDQLEEEFQNTYGAQGVPKETLAAASKGGSARDELLRAIQELRRIRGG